MRTPRVLAAMASVALGLTMLVPVHAKTISASGHGPGQVKRGCSEGGDVYFPKTGPKSTYGCMHSDGSGIVCGGVKPKYQRTCDTFRQAPVGQHLPSRKAAGKTSS